MTQETGPLKRPGLLLSSQFVDGVGDRRGAEPVVDVDDGDA
jgi:hypothetical protein